MTVNGEVVRHWAEILSSGDHTQPPYPTDGRNLMQNLNQSPRSEIGNGRMTEGDSEMSSDQIDSCCTVGELIEWLTTHTTPNMKVSACRFEFEEPVTLDGIEIHHDRIML